MPTYPLQVTCLSVIYFTPVLSFIFVALRIYTRRKLNLRLGWDDWLIIIPLLLSIALIGPSYKHVKMWHVGVHIYDVPPNEIEPNYDEYYAVVMAFNLINIPILPLVKASIILLLLRAGSVIEWLKKALYGILIFTVGSALIPWCLYIFICPPQTGNTWKPRTFGGLRCMGRHRMGEMLIWVTCANLLTDLLIFPIPFIIVRRMMSARLRSRMVVLAVFTSSLAVAAIGGAKIYLSYRDRLFTLFKPDWTYPIDYCINHIENCVAITVANIPIMRGLVTRWVFNFKTKATPIERDFRSDWQWDSSSSSTFTRVNPSRRQRLGRKILPCIDQDFSFSSSLAGSNDVREPEYPPKIKVVTMDYRKELSYKSKSRKSRRNSLDRRYEEADYCEKGDVLEKVTSIGSLRSAPTLVESMDGGVMGWRLSDGSSMSSGRRMSSPTLSPISPLMPCALMRIEDDQDDDIYPTPYP